MLFTSGLDQNPIDKINKRGIKSKVMPTFKPAKSARIPIISGKTAPPIIPETNIPEKAPWSFDIEFKAREIIIDHIIDIKKPINGNENRETFNGPKSDIKREMIEADVKKINIFLLSIFFNKKSPEKVPSVINPQKYEIILAPIF